jgi:hypothetical protein
MIITIDDAENTVYYINCNPLTNTYHVGSVAPNVHMSSGQPISVRSIVSSEVVDMIYEVYTEVLEGMDDEGDVPYPTNWSVGYDRAGATAVGCGAHGLYRQLSGQSGAQWVYFCSSHYHWP